MQIETFHILHRQTVKPWMYVIYIKIQPECKIHEEKYNE